MKRIGTIAVWSTGLTLALGLHAAGAYALLAHWHDDVDALAGGPAIMLELAPVAIAPAMPPNDAPPGPLQNEARAVPDLVKPVDVTELPPAAQAELKVTPPKPVEKPKDKDQPRKHASLASAPSATERQAERAAAPAPGASTRSDALSSWQSQLMARLERNKRYPAEAQSRGERGETQLAFSVDRNGGVHRARIVRSSGSAALDRETLALVERAQPLPPPPPEIPGAQIAVTVPIRYNFR